MKLILVYGPPAVGKLAVAEALRKITDFKLLHNHLIADLIGSIFGYGNPSSKPLNHAIRMSVYGAAINNNLDGLISTFVYYPEDRVHEDLQNTVDYIQKNGGEIDFVRLFCDNEELMKRVEHPSRIGTKKLQSKERLREILSNQDAFSELPTKIAKSLSIDNTDLDPDAVASIIKKNFGL